MDRHVDVLRQRALGQLAHGDARGAVESLREALSHEPDDPSLHAVLAVALLACKRRHAARVEAETAVALAPELAVAHRALGYARLAFRDLRGAGEAFAQSAALAPDDAEAHLALGRLHAAARREGPARAAFQRALALAPWDPDPVVALGELELQAGRVGAARERALAALAESPDHEDALELMGWVLLAEGRTAEAREHALWILRQNATRAGAIHLLCAAQARRSPLLGLWWRWNAFMATLADGRSILILVGLYVAQRLATLALLDAGMPSVAASVSWAWIAFAAYTWLGPALFIRALRRELAAVRLRPGF